MKKRIGSFVLSIVSIVLLYSTAYAENHQVSMRPPGQVLEAATFVANQPVENAPPVDRKLPAPPEVKGLPPDENDERRKLQERYLGKDEIAGSPSFGRKGQVHLFHRHSNSVQKYENPRGKSPRTFLIKIISSLFIV